MMTTTTKQGLGRHEAGRLIAGLLKKNGFNKAEIGHKSRIGQRSVLTSGYELDHLKASKQIDIQYRVSQWDHETDGAAKLREIKSLIENSGFDVECSIVGNRLTVSYKTPFDQSFD